MTPPEIGNFPLPPTFPNPVVSAGNAMVHQMEQLGELLHARSPKGMVEHIVREIRTFEDQVPAEYELSIQLLGAAGQVSFQLRDITAYESGLMVFAGSAEDGTPARVLQHVSQVSFALGAVKRAEAESTRRPIGFHIVPESAK